MPEFSLEIDMEEAGLEFTIASSVPGLMFIAEGMPGGPEVPAHDCRYIIDNTNVFNESYKLKITSGAAIEEDVPVTMTLHSYLYPDLPPQVINFTVSY